LKRENIYVQQQPAATEAATPAGEEKQEAMAGDKQ
jgi:hypothetical protein